MKKALSYATTAVLLGTAMMLAPWMLAKQIYYGSALGLNGGTLSFCREREALTKQEVWVCPFGRRVVYPSTLLDAGLILVPSLLFALGVSLYLKKRMF